MPINVYTGLMRSGKSYEVVAEVIVPAIAAGRRVVTNVDGINNDLVRGYVSEKKKIPIDKLGTVIHCTNEDVFKDDFFPYYDDKKSAITETFVQPGDIVCIDEAWRFWGTDCKIHKHHRSFFLEHGHFVNPQTHVACDLVLMIQDMGTLHRSVKAVVAFSFRTHKKVSLGMSNTYSINMWEGSKMNKGSMIGSWVRQYKKEIFPLYSSFKGGVQGKLVNSDKRQNTLLNPRLWFIVGLAIFGGGFAFFNVWRFFNPLPKHPPVLSDSKVDPKQRTVSPTGQPVQPKKASPPEFSDTWRLVGRFDSDGKSWVVVSNAAGRLRVESPSMFSNTGLAMIGDIDNQKTTFWSGAKPAGNAPAMPKELPK